MTTKTATRKQTDGTVRALTLTDIRRKAGDRARLAATEESRIAALDERHDTLATAERYDGLTAAEIQEGFTVKIDTTIAPVNRIEPLGEAIAFYLEGGRFFQVLATDNIPVYLSPRAAKVA